MNADGHHHAGRIRRCKSDQASSAAPSDNVRALRVDMPICALFFPGPKGADGYPERIWDKRTGLINKTTAAYWKEHFDLQHILERDAAVLAPKLANKIHLFVGASDTFFLTDAVMDMQDFLNGDAGKVYNATVLIGTHEGRGFEHCFNGYGKAMGDTAPLPNSVSGVGSSMLVFSPATSVSGSFVPAKSIDSCIRCIFYSIKGDSELLQPKVCSRSSTSFFGHCTSRCGH